MKTEALTPNHVAVLETQDLERNTEKIDKYLGLTALDLEDLADGHLLAQRMEVKRHRIGRAISSSVLENAYRQRAEKLRHNYHLDL